jgi:hypothetical protein
MSFPVGFIGYFVVNLELEEERCSINPYLNTNLNFTMCSLLVTVEAQAVHPLYLV